MTIRLLTSGDTEKAKNFLWTDEAKISYQTSPDKFKVYAIEVSKNFTDDGKFYVSNTRYAESEVGGISQIQTTIRWNNSTVKYLMADNNLTEISGEPFIFTLTDNTGKIYKVNKKESDTKPLYNYRRLVFDGVDFTDVNFFYINIYYAGTYDPAAAAVKGSDENAYGTLAIYNVSDFVQEYKLNKNELPK
jgi:hypothetical protein